MAAKQNYQACRYGQVAETLPTLLRSLRAACTQLNGDAQLQAHALSAEDILRAAGEIAPEEVAGREAALRLVRDILATAPISVRREAREYAESVGVIA